MKFLTANAYTEYGRYISRFRATPLIDDCLIISDRRLLYVASTLKPKPGKRYIKSLKVISETIQYHPHGEASLYDTLAKLVRLGFMNSDGAWGERGWKDSKQPAVRYTDCILSDWVRKLAFEYCNPKYIEWGEIEVEEEPIYLPSPIPLGLIGEGLFTGISFYNSTIPRYKLTDLAKRLKWLLDNKEGDEPIIIPNIPDCIMTEVDENSFKTILTNGSGKIKFTPKGKIIQVDKELTTLGQVISIQGRAPNSTFTPLHEACDIANKNKEFYIPCRGGEADDIDGEIARLIPNNRNVDLKSIFKQVWTTYLIKNIKISVIICDINGIVSQVGIDDILLTGYNRWNDAVYKKRLNDFENVVNDLFENTVLKIVRKIFIEHNCKTMKQLETTYISLTNGNNIIVELDDFDKPSKTWITKSKEIKPEDVIEIANKKRIPRIIETDIDLNKIKDKINEQKKIVEATDSDCYLRVISILGGNI